MSRWAVLHLSPTTAVRFTDLIDASCLVRARSVLQDSRRAGGVMVPYGRQQSSSQGFATLADRPQQRHAGSSPRQQRACVRACVRVGPLSRTACESCHPILGEPGVWWCCAVPLDHSRSLREKKAPSQGSPAIHCRGRLGPGWRRTKTARGPGSPVLITNYKQTLGKMTGKIDGAGRGASRRGDMPVNLARTNRSGPVFSTT